MLFRSRGMTTRAIQGHLQEIYGVDVSPSLISEVTDGVWEEVQTWQSRPLERLYAIVYLDALFVKMRHEGRVENRAVYVAIGIALDGRKEVLGLWTADTEGAKFWLTVMTELRNCGVGDILIACVDGLKGFPEAIESVFPKTQVQLCIVHLIRNSFKYVGHKDKRNLATDLKAIYSAPTSEAAQQELDHFAEKWGKTHQSIEALWRRNWDRIIPFFSFAPEIRKIIYTTNAVESLNMSLRKITKMRAAFPSEQAAIKLLYMALKNRSAKWESTQSWSAALNQFTLLWEDRIRAAR